MASVDLNELGSEASSLWAFLLETSNSPLSTKRGLATYELAGEVGLLEMRELSFLTPG